MKVFLMMALVLVVAVVVFPAGIQAQGYSPNAWRAEVEARSRAWQRMQEDLQRGRAETQQRMREAWQRNQEAWQRSQVEARKQFDRSFQTFQEYWQRIEENRAKEYSTYDRVYRPGEKHWSAPTQAQLHMDLGEPGARYGQLALDIWNANNQFRQEAAERQRQAAAQRAQNDSRLMGGPNYRPQPRTPATVRDGGPRDRDVPQRLSPASAAAIRDIERQLTRAQNSTGRDTKGRSSGQSSPSRSASPQREDRTRDTPAREKKDWFDRVLEKGSRRP